MNCMLQVSLYYTIKRFLYLKKQKHSKFLKLLIHHVDQNFYITFIFQFYLISYLHLYLNFCLAYNN